jgi:hypothetical protein
MEKEKSSNHCNNDEELKCLIEAKRLFEKGHIANDCMICYEAWRLIDQAILAKYAALAKEHRRGHAET